MMMTMTQDLLGLACGALVGFSLGLVGGGGSVLAVPLMVYVVGVPSAHVAIGTSAVAVAVNAAVNLSAHARSGNVIWRYQRPPAFTAAYRGTSVYDNKVFIATTDAHLVALDARSGGVVWDVPVDGGRRLSGMGPYIAKDKLIVGVLDQIGQTVEDRPIALFLDNGLFRGP